MRRPVVVVLLLAALAGCGDDDGSPTVEAAEVATTTTASTTSTPAPGGATLTLELTGDGPGTATATLSYDGDELCSTITTDGTGPIAAGHVHAIDGGAIVVDLGHVTTTDPATDERCVVVGAEGGVVFEDPASYELDLQPEGAPDGALAAPLG